jgi:RNA polymerase sigma-70 factor, ECF subfamily
MTPSAPVARVAPCEPRPTFEEVYELHFDFVWRSLRRLGVAASGLDDATQEVFLVVHRRLHEFEGRARLTTWLFRIALNIAEHHKRRALRKPSEPLNDTLATHTQTPQEVLAQRQEHELVYEILAKLDDEKRTVFVLAELEEISPNDIALILGVPVNTVYSRLRVARQQFVEHLRRHQHQTERTLPHG